jgi:hypothetical protein
MSRTVLWVAWIFSGKQGGPFIGGRGLEWRWPEGGGPTACNGRCRARRHWERAGEVRSRRLGTVGVLWRAHAGQKLAERQRGKERGPVLFLSFSWVSRAGSGQVRLGIDSTGLYKYGDDLGRTESTSATVD